MGTAIGVNDGPVFGINHRLDGRIQHRVDEFSVRARTDDAHVQLKVQFVKPGTQGIPCQIAQCLDRESDAAPMIEEVIDSYPLLLLRILRLRMRIALW